MDSGTARCVRRTVAGMGGDSSSDTTCRRVDVNVWTAYLAPLGTPNREGFLMGHGGWALTSVRCPLTTDGPLETIEVLGSVTRLRVAGSALIASGTVRAGVDVVALYGLVPVPILGDIDQSGVNPQWALSGQIRGIALAGEALWDDVWIDMEVSRE